MKLSLALLVHFIHMKYCGSVHNIRSHFPYHTQRLDMCAKTSRAKKSWWALYHFLSFRILLSVILVDR